MKKLGSSVWWSISDDTVLTPEVLAETGFAKMAPRNDAKTAILKACKVVKKDWVISDTAIGATADTPKVLKKADHRRFKDSTIECKIALTRPRIGGGGGFSTETAMTITLLKSGSRLSYENVALAGAEFDELTAKLNAEYERARQTIDATQFRLLVARYVTKRAGARSLRAFSGGIYFVTAAYTERLDAIKGLFARLDKGKALFDCFPIYDDGTDVADAVGFHVTASFEKELATFLADLQDEVKAGISKKTLAARMATVEEIKTKIADHKDHLRKKADDLSARTDRWLGRLAARFDDAKGKTVEPFDLLAELAEIDEAMAKIRKVRS